jgi:hypothetical protein
MSQKIGVPAFLAQLPQMNDVLPGLERLLVIYYVFGFWQIVTFAVG